MDYFLKKFIEQLNLVEMLGYNHIFISPLSLEKKQKIILRKTISS